jgi:universal stress protein E
MSGMDKILVVLNSEASNEAVAARLVEIASGSTSVELLAIVHEPHLDGYLGNTKVYEPLRKRLVEESSAHGEELARHLRDEGLEASSRAIWDWPRGEAIRREASVYGADLIILSFGLGHDRHLGSREWRFLAECPLPILVVNRAADQPYRSIVAAVDPVHAHAKPVGLDHAIVRMAAALHDVTGAKLALVHSFVPLSRYGSKTADIDRLPLNDAERALEASRKEAVTRLAAEASLDPDQARLIEGGPESVLQNLMEQGEAELVVMGALARGKLADFIIGSTAERLLRHAGADILLVKPGGPPA